MWTIGSTFGTLQKVDLKKKLVKLAKDKQCTAIGEWIQSILNHLYWCAVSTPDGNGEMIAEKWLSLNNHIVNIHTKHGRVFEKCAHGRLPAAQNRKKKWLKADSVPALKLNKVVSQKAFVRDVKKMSPSQQTYGVEVYHSIVNQFAPKMYAYSYTGMYCRLYACAKTMSMRNLSMSQIHSAVGGKNQQERGCCAV
ncbi:hypothetical protein F7725_000713 [Dissostichus mawsoni]|uniref:Uncharacterized protein n=1 Tax=Dissostichus mawsoni TaxID=36200 RepID=A0A7J5ZJF3_DISMA|nr:hypothetical protein F7725_000713 [Dissostichus mawsoni]